MGMKHIYIILISAMALVSCQKNTVLHEVGFYCHSDSVGFELQYIGRNNDTNHVTVNDTHVTVYPFQLADGAAYMATVVAHDYASRVEITMYVDGVETMPDVVLPVDSFALLVSGMLN